jgi:hypothetical protein
VGSPSGSARRSRSGFQKAWMRTTADFVDDLRGATKAPVLREERVVRNEDRFRQTNEGIENLTPVTVTTFQIFCECADSEWVGSDSVIVIVPDLEQA